MTGASVRLAAKRLFARLGFEVGRTKYATTFETVTTSLFGRYIPDAVLDVGANTGQYGESIRQLGFEGDILSFEPLPDAYDELVACAKKYENWHVAPRLALGKQSGEAMMNVAANSVSSSLLPMLDSHLNSAPDSRYCDSVSVQVDRLDARVSAHVKASASLWLKIDTQGFEKEVLLGATGLLPKIVVIQTELSLVPLYDGGPTFSEMVRFIEELGYEIYSVVPGFRDQATGRLLQVDGFFVKRADLSARVP